jgi:hypothetical protein
VSTLLQVRPQLLLLVHGYRTPAAVSNGHVAVSATLSMVCGLYQLPLFCCSLCMPPDDHMGVSCLVLLLLCRCWSACRAWCSCLVSGGWCQLAFWFLLLRQL